MNKKIKGILISSIIIVNLLVTTCNIYAATVALLDWELVDSRKHLDWDGDTRYEPRFKLAVETWEEYKPGIIRRDTASVIQDVFATDYYEVSTTAGVTSADKTIKFNTYIMADYGKPKRRNVCTHELGHALGLAHNTKNDIMYKFVTQKIDLSDNDKASYDASYKRY